METTNAITDLQAEVDWLQQVIDQVIRSYLLQEGHEKNWLNIPVPDLNESDSPYACMVRDWELDTYCRLAIALTLAPHIRPEILDVFFGKNAIYDRGFTEFGGVADKNHSGFLPTGQTFCFLVTATDHEKRTEVMKILDKDHRLFKEQVLVMAETDAHIPRYNALLSLSDNWLHYLLTGSHPKPEHSQAFPAQRITTNLEWEEVVLESAVMEQVHELISWLKHGETLLSEWGLYRKLKPGYRALFFGPPGTGKTLTATLLGKMTQREVYKVDLSMIVSKYIGETEKNLSRIFDIAEHKNWILFFDEADALFGKRTSTNSSNDRHANQQTAYLLQRIEDFPGVVILASNLKANMDDAFMRRFQSVIQFNIPGVEERMKLWKQAFSGPCVLDPEIDLWEIANEYEIAGGAIINVLRYCALSAIRRNDPVVSRSELLKGLKKEFRKENKTLTVAG